MRQTNKINTPSHHALVFSPEGLEKSKLPIDNDGYIMAEFGVFGKEYELFTEQEEKLSYLLSQCQYLDPNMDDNIYFQTIEKYVCKYTGAKGIRISERIFPPEIDPQSAPTKTIKLVNYNSEDAVISFIFNKNVWLKTECG